MKNERAVSPVVSVALLIGIVVVMATTIGLALSDLSIGTAESPRVTLSFEVVDDEIKIKHEGGDPLEADEIVVMDQDGGELAGLDQDLMAGERSVIVENVTGIERVSVVWQDPQRSTEFVLATFKL